MRIASSRFLVSSPALARIRCQIRVAAFFTALIVLRYTLGAAPVSNEIMYRPGTGLPENTALDFVEFHHPDAATTGLAVVEVRRVSDLSACSRPR